jgi:hypothetical protein
VSKQWHRLDSLQGTASQQQVALGLHGISTNNIEDLEVLAAQQWSAAYCRLDLITLRPGLINGAEGPVPLGIRILNKHYMLRSAHLVVAQLAAHV